MPSYTKRIGQRGTRWEARIRQQNYPTITKTFSLKSDAEAWATETERSLERGYYQSVHQRESLGDILKRYIHEITPTKRGAKEETLRIGKILRHPIAEILVYKLKPTDIAKYRDERLNEVSSSTTKKELVLINHIIETARKEWGTYLTVNPLDGIRKPTENPQRDRRLGSNELEGLVISCGKSINHWFEPLVVIAIETGMRRGELLGLLWQDVDLDKRTAFLPLTKNGSSRTIPLSLKAIDTLQSLPRDISGMVFPVSKTALRGLWLRACKRAKIEDFRFHDLRHEATSRFFEKGLNVMEVAAITGHKDLRMLQRYTHLRAEDLAVKLG